MDFIISVVQVWEKTHTHILYIAGFYRVGHGWGWALNHELLCLCPGVTATKQPSPATSFKIRVPREVVMSSSLSEFKKHLDNALSHMV